MIQTQRRNPYRYDRFFLFDLLVVSCFVLSILFLYIAYSHFLRLHNSLQDGTNEKDGELHFISFSFSLMYDGVDEIKEKIKEQLKKEFYLLGNQIIESTNEYCYIQEKNTYLDIILKTLQIFQNPMGSQICALENANHMIQIEFMKKVFHFKMTLKQIQSIFIYSYRSVELGIPSIAYLTTRISNRIIYWDRDRDRDRNLLKE